MGQMWAYRVVLGLGFSLAIFAGGISSAITISRNDGLGLPAMMVAPAIMTFPIAAIERGVELSIGR